MFSSFRKFSENPLLSLPSVVSWFIRPVSTDTGDATQNSQSLSKFYEFVPILWNIFVISWARTKVTTILCFRDFVKLVSACSKPTTTTMEHQSAWMGQLINDKAQNTQSARVQSFNSTIRKWQSREDALASIAAATASLR
jgi:hypothetical protein